MENITFIVSQAEEGLRIDKLISLKTKSFSREKLKELFLLNKVFLNSLPCKASTKAKENDLISFTLPKVKEIEAIAQNIPLNIVYEDRDVIVVDKPQGLVVHPADGNWDGTLVNALLYHCKDLSGINGAIRPGIVHRIDKDTSGLLVVCKNDLAHEGLSKQFKDHSITRNYIAAVQNNIEENEGEINAPIGRNPINRKEMCVTFKNSKNAITHFNVLERFGKYTILNLKLETGRTHQIRVHMKYISHPVVGDKVYGFNNDLDKKFIGQLLHAYKLGFIHPRTGEYLKFESPLPEYFNNLPK